MPSRVLLVATTLASVTITAMPAHARPPFTVPAIREWKPAHGSYRLPKNPRIVAGPRLGAVAKTLAGDLHGRVAKQHGDIRLELGAKGVPKEGYRLKIGAAGVRIAARTPTGAFWATRPLLQLAHHSRRLPAGRARDWPRYPDRGLMIDNGRKYFTPKWIAREIRHLSYLKLNRLHLHFSDNQGFRIESHTHPEAVSNPHLTQKQSKNLVALGRRYHVALIPEIDMPGHMQAALAKHPELQLTDVNGQRAPDKLDYTKPEARKFARELVGEFLRLF